MAETVAESVPESDQNADQNAVMETCWALDGDCSPVHEALYELRQASSLCDVCIVDEAGVAVMAHSCVLAAGSSVLKNMLLLKQTTNMLKRNGVSVKIKGITAQVWTIILKYLYIGKAYIPVETTIMEQLYVAAKMLGITTLQNLLATNWTQLGYDIDVNKPVGPINVTLAPTGVTKKIHRSIQCDLGPSIIQTKGEGAPKNVLSSPVPVVNVHAATPGGKYGQVLLPIKKEKQQLPQAVDSLVEVSQNATGKKFMVEYFTNQNSDQVTEQMETVTTLPGPSTVQAGGQTYMLEEVAGGGDHDMDEAHEEGEPINTAHLHQLNTIDNLPGHLSCKYCSMKFEKKLALVDHIMESCTKLRRPKVFPEKNDASFAETIPYVLEDDVFWYCPNDKCTMKFNATVEHAEYNRHLVTCLMDSRSKMPVQNVTEQNGCLIYDYALPLKLNIKPLKIPHAVEIQQPDGEAKLYQCGQCDFIDPLEGMAEHLAIVHLKSSPYTCNICRNKFNNLVTFKQHYVRLHKRSRPVKRDPGDDEGGSKRKKWKGKQNVIVSPKSNRIRWLHCPNEECDVEFNGHTENKKYLNHIVSCLMAKGCALPVFYTKDTNTGLIYDDGLPSGLSDGSPLAADRLLNIKGSPQYQCKYCVLSCNRERIANHLAVVHGKRRPFCCKHCASAYGYVGSLIDHYTSAHTTKTYECMHCSLTFNKKDTLRRHVLRIHKREGKERHMCKGCGRFFSYAHHARRHERHHISKRDYKCLTCGKAFYTKQDLERHQDVHTGVKNFRCCRCNFTSARRSNLILHERKHGVVYGEYVCTTCDKYYQSESRFKGHIESKGHQGGHISQFTTGETTTVEESLDPSGGSQTVNVNYRTIKYQVQPTATKAEPIDEIEEESTSSNADLSHIYSALGEMDMKKMVGVLDASNNITYIQASDLPQLLAQENAVRVIVDQSAVE